MRDLPQADHADLGLIEGQDLTEDLRRNVNAPGVAATTAEGQPGTHQINEKGNTMMTETTACDYCRQLGHTHTLCAHWHADGCPLVGYYEPPAASPGYGCSGSVPTTLLDSAANHATMALEDLDDQLAEDDDLPLWSVVDLTAARAHLLIAQQKIAKAIARINEAAIR